MLRALMLCFGFFVLSAFVVASSEPLDVEGQDAKDFRAAVNTWLSGDEREALEQLAILARADNQATQVLLGLLATRELSLWILALPRKQRIALLRAPGGPSGKSWLQPASQSGDKLASLLQSVGVPPFTLEKLVRLINAGEQEAAVRYVLLLTAPGIQVAGELGTVTELLGPDGVYAPMLPLIEFAHWG